MSKLKANTLTTLDQQFSVDVKDLININKNSFRTLAPRATVPTTRDNGEPLQVGDTCYNTVDKVNYRYNGVGWALEALFLGTYQAGIRFVSRAQIIEYNGTSYQLKTTSAVPYTTTGTWASESVKFKEIGDGVLRKELAVEAGADLIGGIFRKVATISALRGVSKVKNDYVRVVRHSAGTVVLNSDYYLDASDTTSPDDNGLVIVASDGGRWKLAFGYDIDIKVFGLASNADFTVAMNTAALALHKRGGGTLRVSGDFTQSGQIGMLPHVTIKGSGSGSSPRITVTHLGAAYETIRPSGWANNMCIDSHVQGLTLIGPGKETQAAAFSIRNAMQCGVRLNEIALFNLAFIWNKGTTATNLEQAFFNVIEQNMIKPCKRGHYFGGAANRNEFRTNSIADADIAYDFGAQYNYSETNTFTNENIEGCKSWAEWGDGIVYSQTWVGICIENPSTNPYTCLVKDPGRQVFLNLSLIPLGDEDSITMYQVNDAVPSKILGSDASSGINRTGFIINEPLALYDQIHFHTNHASTIYSGTIPPNASLAISIPLSSAAINDRAIVSALRQMNGCLLNCYATNGAVMVDIINPTINPVVITDTEISVIAFKCK